MDLEKAFIKLFKKIAPHQRRSEVFYNFITIFGLEFYFAIYQERADERLQAQYKNAVKNYNDTEREQLCQLFIYVVNSLQQKSYDFLGSVFMGLELGDGYKGQYFTPPHIAGLMAAVVLSDCHSVIQKKGFISLQEPTCGSGVMIIESYNYLRKENFNPQQQLWVQARDLDYTAAMMCYIQMTLLHIPGEVIIGDTLSNEVNYHLYTPAHILGNWDFKLSKGNLNTETDTQIIETESVKALPPDIDLENETVFY